MALWGCARYPAPGPPPEQYPAEPARHYAFLGREQAGRFVVSGVEPETHEGEWRWTGRRAALRFRLDETEGLQFRVEMKIPPELAAAGARRMAVRIGPHELGAIPLTGAGYMVWEKPVPAEWLSRDRDVEASLEADRAWKQGAEERGVMLMSAGFTP